MAQATPVETKAIDAAHAQVRADSSIQFDFPWRELEKRQESPWLKAFGESVDRFFTALGPFWQVLFWIMIAVIVAVLLFAFVPPLREWLREFTGRTRVVAEPEWRPEQSVARALLEEAEALAAAGRFEAAIQLLLYRSIEDIERWRGGIVRPSLTARDIAAVPDLPRNARGVFGQLVALTERGIFARRPTGQSEWDEARDAYRAFAL